MSINHVEIVDPNIHEGKGVATATVGSVPFVSATNTTEHRVIAASDVSDFADQEPKGADTALVNQVYISDGAGSGAWQLPAAIDTTGEPANSLFVADGAGAGTWKLIPHGWGYYKDAAAAQTINTTPAILTNDNLGTTSNSEYLPAVIRGTGELWNSSTSKLEPIALGDTYSFRIDLPITAKTGSPTELKLQVDIGGAASPTIVIIERFIAASKTPPYTLSITTSLFVLSTFLANGADIFLSTDAGTLTVTNPAFKIGRSSAGDF